MNSKLRAVWRVFLFFGWTFWTLIVILFRSSLRRLDIPGGLELRRNWARVGTDLVGLKVQTNGLQDGGIPCIYISNHRSYADPIIALREVKAFPVAKEEFRNWPIIGFAAYMTGILFVKREQKSSRRATLDGMAEVLKQGHSILIYPETKTHNEPTTIPFRYGSFRLAAELGVPIVPIAIDYSLRTNAWIHRYTFVGHFLRNFGRKKIPVTVIYGPPFRHDDFETLLSQCQAWMDQHLLEIQESYRDTYHQPNP
ncbi:MAG: 1-acyl-sn-glycerol-3-phosphate acyltransferase [Saprospiraceae bacterium]|nr:1-acyl-sn-glycerol-3-phosphate acyltransferase [Saprospiraceae bacterium]MCB0625733.1 1-acyl-sn-glycerol-3-phosphate acyltransferase [Saprospiraceae bacterium]MCB0681062.1 1-acyl-sn-glycerol-3-phosphate acyltransferase [Saprospiraceae bacterium]